MKTKLLLSSMSALAVGTSGLFAQAVTPAPAAAPSMTVTATASVVSQYMFRGLRLSSSAFQPSVEVAAGDLTAGVWMNVPFDGNKVPDGSDPEIDLYGSYTFKLSDVAALVPGFTSYHFPKAPTSAGFYKWSFEPSLALNYTVAGFKLTPKVYYDLHLEGPTLELSAFYAVPLTDLGSELDFTATAGSYKWKEFANNASPAVKAWGNYWLVGVSMPFQISRAAKLTVGLAYTEGDQAFTKAGSFPKSVNTGAVGRGVGTVSYSWSF